MSIAMGVEYSLTNDRTRGLGRGGLRISNSPKIDLSVSVPGCVFGALVE